MRSRGTASRTRIVLLALAAFCWLGLISYRLFELQVLRHTEFSRQVERQHQRTLDVTPRRGTIYDRNGRELAVSISVDSIFAVPSEVESPRETARTLARLLRSDATEIENRLRSSRSFVWIERKVDAAVAEKVRKLKLHGIHFEKEHKRFYPKRELAAHVLGFVGLDEDGLGGLEYAFDRELRGAPERVVITADGRRRTYRRDVTNSPGTAELVVTLDENIQYIAESELARAVRQSGAKGGSVIVQDPYTGEILAMANYPAFNPNNPMAGPVSRHVNGSISLPYEPGSTFKVVTVAAALEEGLTTPLEIIDCQMGGILIAGHLIRDWRPFGRLPVREIFHQSSDVGAIKLGMRLGEERFYEHIRRWGFGEKTGLELPAESRGILRPPKQWSRISIGALSMGQELAVTPVQLAAAVSAVANGGEWVRPSVVRELLVEGVPRRKSPPERRRILSEGVTAEMQRMFAGVVTVGTGEKARLDGYSSAGKTGTAQKIDRQTGTYSETEFVASFAGFAPVSRPAVTVVVTVDAPAGEERGGGDIAAPLFRRITEKVLSYMNIPGDLPPRRGAEREIARSAVTGRSVGAGAYGLVPTRGAGDAGVMMVEEDPLGLLSPPAWAKGAETVVTNDGDAIVVPDLSGLALRQVTAKCARLDLVLVADGSGVAALQTIKPGERVPRGTRIRVSFRAVLPPASTRIM